MILDPNFAYVVLVLGFILCVLALAAPGTGFLEVGAVLVMALAGYTLFQLPFNSWALILLLVGLPFFFFALRPGMRWRQWLLLTLSLLAFWAGSVFMFRGQFNSLAINPWMAGIVSLTAGGFLWLVFFKSIQAQQLPVKPVFSGMEGMEGMALTEISREGSVQVGAETWSACSQTPIARHSRIRVLARKGLILEVEELKA